MARIRTIKPDFFRHVRLYQLERDTGLPIRVAFAGLWTAADKSGRFRWEPLALKLDCLPYDDVDFSRVLDALATRGFIVKYTVDGDDFGHIPGWDRHQVVNNREQQSILPGPEKAQIHQNLDACATREPREDDACPTPLCNSQGEGKGREGEGKEKKDSEANASASDVPFDARSDLFGPKREALQAMTGKREDQCRSLIGRWLKTAKDDASAVGGAIEQARRDRLADPIAWIEAKLRQRGPPRWEQNDDEIYRNVL